MQYVEFYTSSNNDIGTDIGIGVGSTVVAAGAASGALKYLDKNNDAKIKDLKSKINEKIKTINTHTSRIQTNKKTVELRKSLNIPLSQEQINRLESENSIEDNSRRVLKQELDKHFKELDDATKKANLYNRFGDKSKYEYINNIQTKSKNLQNQVANSFEEKKLIKDKFFPRIRW